MNLIDEKIIRAYSVVIERTSCFYDTRWFQYKISKFARKSCQELFELFSNHADIERILEKRIQFGLLNDRSSTFNYARIEALELDNLMAVAKATAHLAKNRKESRGAHSRYDMPERDDVHWQKHSLYFADGHIAYRGVNQLPHKVDPIELQERE